MAYTTYVGFVRDHSGSMKHLANAARADYNLQIAGIRESTVDQNVLVSVVECGIGYQGTFRRQETNVPLSQVRDLTTYGASGGSTPLWDSVNDVINMLAANEPYVERGDAFLVFVTTDGYDNHSRTKPAEIARRMSALQKTDRWTFVFRVPVGHKRDIVALGVPEYNVVEWEQTEASVAHTATVTTSGTANYFKARSAGSTSTSKFYADIGSLKPADVNRELVPVTNYSTHLVFNMEDGLAIKEFFEKRNITYATGRAFYQLTKRETVQDSKKFILRDNKTGTLYLGDQAVRSLLGLPQYGSFKIEPGSIGQYTIFIQSTSVNRKLVGGTNVLYRQF